MRSSAETLRDSQGAPRRRGLTSGYVMKLIRESLEFTQFELSDALRVDVTTIQGWESGRRPVTSLRVSDLAALQAHLIHRGVNPRLFDVLRDAIAADLLIDTAVHCGVMKPIEKTGHPLAATVHRRDLTNLITWTLTGSFPSQLVGLVKPDARRRGPSSPRPELGAEERARFFAHLLRIADECRDEADSLMRRQAIYLLAFDTDAGTASWLVNEHRQALRRARAANDVPSWVAVRSASVALARYGQQEPLIDFVAAGLKEDLHAIANLNYWAYWVGEGVHTYTDDSFMAMNDPRDAAGIRLFRHIIERLDLASEQAELYLHTLWQLLLVNPRVAVGDPTTREAARRKVERLSGADLTSGARRKLSDVAYGLRLS
jgi:DNA-binding transcriptional regulator YiaG